MAGRIRDSDVLAVKERVNIADVVGEHVTLRPAGGGTFMGLCPFHEERTPSMSVRPAVGAFHCFGCGEGGDVIAFVMKVEQLTFQEAVEQLASRAGITLTYEEGDDGARERGQRLRLLAAHRAAAEFYAEALSRPEAQVGRRFLAERGFDADAVARFGVGWAPRDWDALARHLRGRGYRADELITAGLARAGRSGPIDWFRGRLLWPIRSVTGDVIGFGARRLLDDDRIAAKYINTPETPIYHKSAVLYGVDLARAAIARTHRAVIVEGYTDVMAAHLAGVTTAVATCGTAFGPGHVKVLRRLLDDRAGAGPAEVVFTFDGDAAGRRAAQRAFAEDQAFVAQTSVAVEPNGLDPCELRMTRGDAAVRALVDSRVPLIEFVIRSALADYDLDTVPGRVAALRAAAPVVAGVRDSAARPEYARRLAGWLGMEVEPVLRAVAEAAHPPATSRTRAPSSPAGAGAPETTPGGPTLAPGPAAAIPAARDPRAAVQREVLKVVLQLPGLAAGFDDLPAQAFTDPWYRAVHGAVLRAGGVRAVAGGLVPAGSAWVDAVRRAALASGPVGSPEAGPSAEGPDLVGLGAGGDLARLVDALSVEPLRSGGEPDARYAAAQLRRLTELHLTEQEKVVRSRLQRLDPQADPERYAATFSELVALEQARRTVSEATV